MTKLGVSRYNVPMASFVAGTSRSWRTSKSRVRWTSTFCFVKYLNNPWAWVFISSNIYIWQHATREIFVAKVTSVAVDFWGVVRSVIWKFKTNSIAVPLHFTSLEIAFQVVNRTWPYFCVAYCNEQYALIPVMRLGDWSTKMLIRTYPKSTRFLLTGQFRTIW